MRQEEAGRKGTAFSERRAKEKKDGGKERSTENEVPTSQREARVISHKQTPGISRERPRENRGFHELATHWSMNHCFKHDFNAMQNILAMLFLVFGLTRLFFERNVKDPDLLGLTHIAKAGVLGERLPSPGEACVWDPG